MRSPRASHSAFLTLAFGVGLLGCNGGGPSAFGPSTRAAPAAAIAQAPAGAARPATTTAVVRDPAHRKAVLNQMETPPDS